ncbi:tetratricopeptide repeat-containing sensor histidine kinase [Ekhidna sp. To15]|uniref:tetratricopeptide repeat-containing sensor histidine kinase n=1 Tax=Ekhidna sp. To15 TaxID=3395267 RepID=UPI003F51DCED
MFITRRVSILICTLIVFDLFAQSEPDKFAKLKQLSFSNPDSIIQIAKERLLDNKLSSADASYYHLLAGIAYRNAGQFKEGIDHSDTAFQLSKIEKVKANSYHNKAVCYRYLGEYDSAISYNLKALKIFENEGDLKEQAIVLNSLGVVNMKSGDYTRALYYYNQTLELNDGTDIDNLSDVLNNIAIIYANTGKLDSSEMYFRKSLNYEKRVNNLKGISAGLNNLGALKYYQNDLDSSIIYFQKSLQIDKQLGDKQGIPAVMGNIAEVAVQNRSYRLAESYLDSSILMSKEIGSKRDLENGYLNKAGLYQAQGDFEKAFDHLVTSKAYADSLISEEKNKAIAELETKYETEKKEQQIILQESQLAEQTAALQRNRVLLIASILVIIFIITLALLQRSRLQKKQQLKLQEAQLQAREAEINATISSQEKERARYARDLHDGFGQMISILNMNLKNLKDGAKPNERQEVFEASSKVIDDMYGELKNICFDLMPQTLIKHGLESALKEFADRINHAGKVHLELNTFGLDERLQEIQEISLYRISQEWTNNILKYSDASKVTLQITKDEGEITLLIEDDGSGFDKTLLISGKGNGWKNLNTRTNLIQGELELETREGVKGNVLIVNAPSTIKAIEESFVKV